ncbi:2-(hydroxymethyl)glutarate dehydrogenase [compost metagenome]
MRGAKAESSIRALASQVRLVLVCTSGSAAINDCYFGANGLLVSLHETAVVIDISTIDPGLAIKLHAAFEQQGMHYLECPVSGGIEGAEAGSLSSIISGSASAYSRAKPTLESFCYSTVFIGEPGKAQRLKILNNLAETINLAGALEVIVQGQAQGLDVDSMSRVLKVCRGRSAYMDVALAFVCSGGESSNVSLAVRCKDLDLAGSVFGEACDFPISNLAMDLFRQTRDILGATADQCEYFSLLKNKKASK